MARVTLRAINDELARRGIPGELVKGSGYFYMADLEGEPTFWAGAPETSIYVYSLAGSGLTVSEWADAVLSLYVDAGGELPDWRGEEVES